MLVLLALGAIAPAQQTQQDPEARSAIRVLQDASRALQAGNPAAFLKFFDRDRCPQYPVLESHLVALTMQSDVASSIDVIAIERVEDTQKIQVDWLLQLSIQETPGPLETRREVLRISMVKGKKDAWKIVGLDPADFFRPQGSVRP